VNQADIFAAGAVRLQMTDPIQLTAQPRVELPLDHSRVWFHLLACRLNLAERLISIPMIFYSHLLAFSTRFCKPHGAGNRNKFNRAVDHCETEKGGLDVSDYGFHGEIIT